MSRRPRLIQLPLVGKLLLGLLAIVYVIYLGALVHFLSPTTMPPASETVVEHPENASVALTYWNEAKMLTAVDVDQAITHVDNATVDTSVMREGKAARQKGQAPRNGNAEYPLSTVGKIFFSNGGQNYVCSGSAIVSANRNTVDTAGHCLYWNSSWVQNVIFCPLYDNGTTPYGCWAARDLEVPSDWLTDAPYDLHHDMGMAIVVPNDEGSLTDVVGGAGWAYNQSTEQAFYAYGYPAAPPFDGQTRQSCTASTGEQWKHGGGTVVSIPCNMTGGSSGGPWFIKVGGTLYLNGHNDFTSSAKYGHMFSPYYDDTWYTLYNKAQRT